MRFLKSIHRYIPGFRQLSGQSIAVAATYYIAALVILFQVWYIGLAMLALPFLIFNLIDLNAGKGRRLPLAVACAAGFAVLLSATVALSSGGVPAGAAMLSGDHTPEIFTSRPTAQPSPAATIRPAASKTYTATPAPSASGPAASSAAQAIASAPATANPDQAQYAYVAARGSEVFHLPGCSSAKRIKPENLIGYQTRDEAVKAGLRPCKRCKP